MMVSISRKKIMASEIISVGVGRPIQAIGLVACLLSDFYEVSERVFHLFSLFLRECLILW